MMTCSDDFETALFGLRISATKLALNGGADDYQKGKATKQRTIKIEGIKIGQL